MAPRCFPWWGRVSLASVLDVCRAAIRETTSLEPRPEEAAVYARGHNIYKALYPALKVVK